MTPDLARLLDWFRPHAAGGVALAYSGGIDSAVLLAALATLRREHDFPCVALTLSTPLQRHAEIDEARALAEGFGVPWQKVETNPLAEPAVATNAPDRCYACKRLMMARLREAAQGFTLLIDGTNTDDRRATNRPGLRALDELGVRSPLAELGFSKAAVRALARELDLPAPDRPATPCLATRFPYGTPLTEAALRRVGAAEDCLCALLPTIRDLRLRDHVDLARIEVPAADFPTVLDRRESILATLRPLGYRFVTLDLAAFRSGSFD